MTNQKKTGLIDDFGLVWTTNPQSLENGIHLPKAALKIVFEDLCSRGEGALPYKPIRDVPFFRGLFQPNFLNRV